MSAYRKGLWLAACFVVMSLMVHWGCASQLGGGGQGGTAGEGSDTGGLGDGGRPGGPVDGDSGAEGEGEGEGDGEGEGEGEGEGDGEGEPDSGDSEGGEDGGEADPGDGGIQSGTLTAGSFDDNLNPGVYDTFAGQFAFESGNSGFPVIELGQRITLVVRNEAGEALGGVRVTIEVEQQSGTLLDMPTRSDGRIVFSTGADGASSATEFLVTVYPPDGSAPETFTEDLSSGSWELVLSGQNAALPVQLDLAFVVDATGSMMDELQYIQVEMTDIVAAISEAFPNVDQRYALIVYRDQGDDYVTRTFDFTGSLEAFNADLSAQRAGGGGDYPEAMHTALQEAEGLSWRGDGTAQVIFLIADAPPHNQDAQAAFDSGMRLRSQGVVIYPVAASGVASEAEYVMRTAALLTGTQYCFLTDDSGVGNPHAEPFVPCYEVERLNRLMVRVISAELMGERLFPDEQDVIRTVGNPVDGVCVDAGQEQGRGQ